MSLYEDWMKKAFSQEGRSIEAVWEEYLPKEQKIYEYILGEKVTKLEGTIAELAARFDMTAEMIVAFIDGLKLHLWKNPLIWRLWQRTQRFASILILRSCIS